TNECVHNEVSCTEDQTCVEGFCTPTCSDNVDCNDGDTCTDDTCVDEACIYEDACDDGDPCTADSCDGSTDPCSHEQIECADTEVCVDGACFPACDTDDDCNGAADPDDEDDNAQGDDDDDDGNPFIVIFEDEEGRDFDLLDLQNGKTDLLADAEVPVGTYTLMRLIVTEGTITLNGDGDGDGGREFTLRVPSGQQTGIKLHFTFEVTSEEDTVLLLDVDLSRAFSPIPGGKIDDPDDIRNFRFSPSVAMRLIRLLDAGSISGTVSNEAGEWLAGVSVTAFDKSEEPANTATQDDGTYVVSGLHTGDYRVEFEVADYDVFIVEEVAVTAGETTEGVNATLTPSSEEEPDNEEE
ncbi:MAG: DUF4382 domain-containing protein, partial [Planctomycetota bacterium]